MISFNMSWLPQQLQYSIPCYLRGTLLCVLVLMISSVHCDDHHLESDQSNVYFEAEIKYTFLENNKLVTNGIIGKYGSGVHPVKTNISGKVVHITSISKTDSSETNHFGCENYKIRIPTVKWIALVERGECEFTQKLRTATITYNASGLVVYDNATENSNVVMNIKDIINIDKHAAVIISREEGRHLIKQLERGINIEMEIHRGQRVISSANHNMNKSSVLFVSITFIIIVTISVTWLMFYYIRKFRYSHTKERLAKRLARAAKKAIAKIPQRTVNAGDKELEVDFDQCAICIEPYKDGDIIRLMPCRHVFHKSCVDPWLLDHRTCPMCKLDILQAYGMSMCKLDMLAYGMQGSQESVHRDTEGTAIMIESFPSGDDGGRSQSTALVLGDQEASSSVDDEIQENSEVKVVLVPHSCLHFHHHPNSRSRSAGERVTDEDEEEEASLGLLGDNGAGATASGWDLGHGRSSTDPINSGGNRRVSPDWGKKKLGHKSDDENSMEMEALIHPSEEDGGHDCIELVEDRGNFHHSAQKAESGEDKKACVDKAEPQPSKSVERKPSDSAQPLATERLQNIYLALETDKSAEVNTNSKQSDV